MPPSSSPPPARPGPPCLSIGSGEPWPVDSAAASRSRMCRRPCHAAICGIAWAATFGSCVTSVADQAAAAARGQGQRLVEVAVGHERAHRAEGLDVVDGVVRHAVAAEQQRRREEGAVGRALAERRERFAAAVDELVAAFSIATRSATSCCCAREASAPIFTPSTAGSPKTTSRQPLAQLRGNGVEMLARHDRAADRGALLPRLDRHLARHLLDEQVELLVARLHVGAEDGGS